MPGILPGRCTHERSPFASCNTCVEICPRGALRHADDGGLTLDEDSCDECALCVGACPEGALTAQLSRPLIDDRCEFAFWACEPAAQKSGEGVLPCLHAATDQMLADLARRGVREIRIYHQDCATCSRRPLVGEELDKRWSAINAANSPQTPTANAVHRINGATWQNHVTKLQETAKRRGFLGRLLNRPASVLRPIEETSAAGNDATAIGVWLREQGTGPLPCLPVVNFNRCTLCGACTKLCMHHALKINDLGEIAMFEVLPEWCTGCNLCMDVCLDDAINIMQWLAPPTESMVALIKRTCKVCKHRFWQSAKNAAVAASCPVCRKSGGRAPNRLVED